MDRVAELEREVAALQKRVVMMQHVAEDMSEFVYGDIDMVALVVDDVLAFWDSDAPARSARDAWHLYANRVEYADAECRTWHPGPAARVGSDPTKTNEYLEACWHDHVEVLQLTRAG